MTIIQVQNNMELDIGDAPNEIEEGNVVEYNNQIFIVRKIAWRYIMPLDVNKDGSWTRVLLCEEGQLIRSTPEA